MEIPKEYPLAVAVALAMNVHCYSAAFRVGGARKKLFNKEFMDKQFGPKHMGELGEQISPGGYPDTGSGLYSQRLSYKDWYRFNVLQRIHLNYIQTLTFATTSTLAAGLYQPRAAAYAGMTFILGRILYSIFYPRKGGALNKMRMLGAFLCIVGLATNTIVFTKNFIQNWAK